MVCIWGGKAEWHSLFPSDLGSFLPVVGKETAKKDPAEKGDGEALLLTWFESSFPGSPKVICNLMGSLHTYRSTFTIR